MDYEELEKELKKEIFELYDLLEDVDKLLTERISDLHNIKGAVGERHAFIHYRSIMWKMKSVVEGGIFPNIEKLKNSKQEKENQQ